MTSAPSRDSSSFPSRNATSSTRSFSSSPFGPIVPVSCPPCPASITMRPIFSPSARIKLRSPSAVGEASWIVGASIADAATVFLLLRDFLSGATVTAVGAAVAFALVFPPAPPGLGKSSSSASGALLRAAIVAVFGDDLEVAALTLPVSSAAGSDNGVEAGAVLTAAVGGAFVDGFAVLPTAVAISVGGVTPSPVVLVVRGWALTTTGATAFCSCLAIEPLAPESMEPAICWLPLFGAPPALAPFEAVTAGAAFAAYSSAATPAGGPAAISVCT